MNSQKNLQDNYIKILRVNTEIEEHQKDNENVLEQALKQANAKLIESTKEAE